MWRVWSCVLGLVVGGCSDRAPDVGGAQDGSSTSSTSAGDGSTTSGTEESTGRPQDVPLAAVCGNGVVEMGEQCDDEGIVGDDGCTEDCQLAGRVRWMRFLDKSTSANAVAVSPAGRIFVAGEVHSDDWDPWVAALTFDGELEWERAWPSPERGQAQAIAIDDDDNVYALASLGDPSDSGTLLWKLDDGGATEFERHLQPPPQRYGGSVRIDGDRILVLEAEHDDAYDGSVRLTELDLDGTERWSELTTVADRRLRPKDMALLANGHIAVLSYAVPNADALDVHLGMHDPFGVPLWTVEWPNGGAHGIEILPDGRLLLAAPWQAGGGAFASWHTAVHVLDPDGSPGWERRYEGYVGPADGRSIALDTLGQIIVTGRPYHEGEPDWIGLRALTADGDTVWTQALGIAEVDSPRAIASGPDATAVVVGVTRPEGDDRAWVGVYDTRL